MGFGAVGYFAATFGRARSKFNSLKEEDAYFAEYIEALQETVNELDIKIRKERRIVDAMIVSWFFQLYFNHSNNLDQVEEKASASQCRTFQAIEGTSNLSLMQLYTYIVISIRSNKPNFLNRFLSYCQD